MKLYKRRRGTNQYMKKYKKPSLFIFPIYETDGKPGTWKAAYWLFVCGIFSLGVCMLLKAVWDDNEAFRNFSPPISPMALVRDVAYAEAPEITPHARITLTALILSKKHGDIVYRIWNLETSKGVHGLQYCQKRGKVNDFGMGVLNKPPMCFDTFEQEVDFVSDWFDTQLQTKTLAEALCYYNQGKKENTCTYTQDFLQY